MQHRFNRSQDDDLVRLFHVSDLSRRLIATEASEKRCHSDQVFHGAFQPLSVMRRQAVHLVVAATDAIFHCRSVIVVAVLVKAIVIKMSRIRKHRTFWWIRLEEDTSGL